MYFLFIFLTEKCKINFVKSLSRLFSILRAKISCFVNAWSLSLMFNFKQVQNGNENDTDGAVDYFFLSFFTWIMVVLNNKYVDMFNL